MFVAGAEPDRAARASARAALARRRGRRSRRPARGPAMRRSTDERSIRAASARDAAAPTLVDARLGALDLDAPAQMLYTSGTSGNPKGVPLTHRNVGRNGADWLKCNAPLLAEGDRDLLWLPMSHIFGFGELCVGNTLGCETYLAVAGRRARSSCPRSRRRCSSACPRTGRSSRDPGRCRARPRRAPTRCAASPAAGCSSASRAAPASRSRSRSFFTPPACSSSRATASPRPSPTLTLNRPDAFRFDTVGKPLPSRRAPARRGRRDPRARRRTCSPATTRIPSATAAAFTDDGWFKTGDVGRFTEDGFLQIIDRKKDILVTAGGKNIPPANIEAAVRRRSVHRARRRLRRCAAVPRRRRVARDDATCPRRRRASALDRRAASSDDQQRELARYETIKRFFVAERRSPSRTAC